MKYFTLQACIDCPTAVARSIDNTPSSDIEAHIVESVETLLDPLCEAWKTYCKDQGYGEGTIRIVAGYRCPELNKMVGGSSTSAHCQGYAFDVVPENGKMLEFKRFCREFLSDKAFDQLISEGEDNHGVPSWMHIGYKHPQKTLQRRQALSMVHGKYCPMTE